jgi:hypothetical protein
MNLREAINTRKAYNKLGFKIYRDRKFATQINRRFVNLPPRDEVSPMERLKHWLPHAHQTATLQGLNSKLDNIINFAVGPLPSFVKSNQRPDENVGRGAGLGFLGGGLVGAGGGAWAGQRFSKENQVYLKRDAFGHAILGTAAGTAARVGTSLALMKTKLGPGAKAAAAVGAGLGGAITTQQVAAGHTLKKRLRGD